MKFGSYKFVMASTPEAVREMLLKKSVEFAGRPQTYSIVTRTLGRYYMFYQYNRTYPEFIHKLLVILLVRGSLILFGKLFHAPNVQLGTLILRLQLGTKPPFYVAMVI